MRSSLFSLPLTGLAAIFISLVPLHAELSPDELIDWAHSIKPTKQHKLEDVGMPDGAFRKRVHDYLYLPLEQLEAHPSAEQFPGAVSAEAKRVTREVEIDLNQPRWTSTGLYAAPGETITLNVPEDLQDLDLAVRIGAHSDNVLRRRSRGGMARFPEISVQGPLDQAEVKLGNPFGGAVFIEVPLDENDSLFTVRCFGNAIRPYAEAPAKDLHQLTVAGAVEAPFWQVGMSPEAWATELEKPAPWAELQLGLLTVSVPTPEAAKIADPTNLVAYWTEVLDGEWNFGGYPGIRVVGQRFVFDRQISAGYMHSGYPIMAAVPQASEVLDIQTLREKGNWGFYHELGHNHQPQVITPDGFTETTVNLFSMGGYHATHPDADPTSFHGALRDGGWRGKLESRLAGQGGAWENLSPYIACIKEFGIDSFPATFKTYWNSANHGEFSSNHGKGTNEQRQDRWVHQYGEQVERNICDFYVACGFHVSAETREALSDFDTWNPTAE